MTRGPSMQARRVDHIDISVDDLRAAKAFFLDLGFELMGEAYAEGEFVKRVIGLKGVRLEIAMLRTTDVSANIELVRFLSPVDDKGLSLRYRIHMAHRDREKRSPGPGLQSETEGRRVHRRGPGLRGQLSGLLHPRTRGDHPRTCRRTRAIICLNERSD